MNRPEAKTIFADGSNAVIGRNNEIERLLAKVNTKGGLAVLAAPFSGSSDLLRIVYDRLFFDQRTAIPFYFEIQRSDATAVNTAKRFVREFLTQAVAHRRSDAGIIATSPDIFELAELALPADARWIDRLVEASQTTANLEDERSMIRGCLAAPLRAEAAKADVFVIIDNLHLLSSIEGGSAFFDEMASVLRLAAFPYILCGRRRFLFGKTMLPSFEIGPLTTDDATTFVATEAADKGILIADHIRDLIAVQLGGIPAFISALFATAAATQTSLSDFESVESLYSDEIFGGRIGRLLDGIYANAFADKALEHDVIGLLAASLNTEMGDFPVSYFKRSIKSDVRQLDHGLTELHNAELIDLSSGTVVLNNANFPAIDHLKARKTIEIDGISRALAVGAATAENVRRAPLMMAREYRRASSIGLVELMRTFDGREISTAILDYERFKAEFKGNDDTAIIGSLASDKEVVVLPQVVFAAEAASFYSRLAEIGDAERSAIAVGFADAANTDRIVWIAAEIDSKLEAEIEVTEFWCDRLEMAAAACSFENYRIWLIAPEGFSTAALAHLNERNAFGSSRKQVALLAQLIEGKAEPAVTPADGSDNFEMTIPMGDEAEMLAANTVEQIARRHNIPQKTINQIKTAVVEACINAAEHSLSPDGKIHQKITVSDEKISVVITNRGVRLSDKTLPDGNDEARRGWGLKLIKGLMDDVSLDATDDGTSITMTKYLSKD